MYCLFTDSLSWHGIEMFLDTSFFYVLFYILRNIWN